MKMKKQKIHVNYKKIHPVFELLKICFLSFFLNCAFNLSLHIPQRRGEKGRRGGGRKDVLISSDLSGVMMDEKQLFSSELSR